MSQDSNEVYCPVPWAYAFIATDGSIKSCVAAYATPGGGNLKDDTGKSLHINRNSLEEARNCLEMKALRKNMLDGLETPDVCQRCIEEEKKGLQSRRSLERFKNYFSLQQARKFTGTDGHIDTSKTPLSVYDIRLGNLCNLSCRMCNPSQSSGWYEEWFNTRYKSFRDKSARLELSVDNGKVVLKDTLYKWYEQDDFWNFFFSNVEQAREVHFSGGEPLLSSKHFWAISEIVSKGYAGDICLDYNSNLTSLPKHLLELWEKFKKVSIGVSIDGFGEVNDYVRYPSQFSKIEANLRMLQSLRSNIEYWATTTISVFNVGRYPELVHWILSSDLSKLNRRPEGSDLKYALSAHVLLKPSELSIQILPDPAKDIVRARYEKFLNELNMGKYGLSEADENYVVEHMRGILRHLGAESHLESCYHFYIETKKSDTYRQQSFKDIDPEIWDVITKHLQETGQIEAAEKMALNRWY